MRIKSAGVLPGNDTILVTECYETVYKSDKRFTFLSYYTLEGGGSLDNMIYNVSRV